jgi:RimJ/RimL family protein N-acetyltransferase
LDEKHNLKPAMITIRRIRKEECDVYKEIRLRALKEAPYAFLTTYNSAMQRSDDMWRQQVFEAATGANQAIFIVFSEENIPIGLAALYRSSTERKSGEMAQVWIAPEYRKREIGTELLGQVIHWGKENEITELEARIMEGNEQAIAFYKKNNFTETGIEIQNNIIEYVLRLQMG